jgi:hypothetical protein
LFDNPEELRIWLGVQLRAEIRDVGPGMTDGPVALTSSCQRADQAERCLPIGRLQLGEPSPQLGGLAKVSLCFSLGCQLVQGSLGEPCESRSLRFRPLPELRRVLEVDAIQEWAEIEFQRPF